jgi:alkaline phosphatase
MSVSTVTAARILDGQLRGEDGEENFLIWEKFPHLSLSKTYNTNQQTPDSAGTASAFMTGYKTSAGVISVAENVKLKDCLSAQKYPLTSFLEIAEDNGLHTGVISTARITHATPATSYAHSPSRGWENNSNLPSKAREQGCIDIAQQLINFNSGNGIDLILGGGRQNFFPKTDRGPEGEKGKRTDKKNLIKEWKDKHEDGHYVWNNKGFNAIPDDTEQPIFGLFNPSHMQYSADRDKSENGEPSLAEMTEKAIKIMKNKDGGYFLFIEAGRIDHGHHANSAYNALHDTIAFARAVEKAVKMTNSEETLIIVTADHSHGFVMGGYSKKGNPILGKVVQNANESHTDGRASKNTVHLAKDKMPYTTIGYYGGKTAEINAGRHDLKNIDTAEKSYKQQALIPLRSGSHSPEDVPIYAIGPSAYLFRGVVEQNYIFHVMMHAMRLEKQ